MRVILSGKLEHRAATRGRATAIARSWSRRGCVVLSLAAGMVASAAADAGAVTLRLAFPDGQPMTHGSACAGLGCLASGRGAAVDERGEV